MATSKTIIGIDLGTTYSLVAVLRDGVPELLPNAVGEVLTPSAVYVDDAGHFIVGAAARARATTAPGRVAMAFKRDMGTDREYLLGTKRFGARELSALVLAELKRDAEAALGRPVDEAVITVPAYFGDRQRQATRDAASLAGLTVERIINEPTAAALAYGLEHRDRELKAIVLDLGGGTFDVTALEILEGVVEIQASAGDVRLGGEDFDDALVHWVGQQLAAQGKPTPTEPAALARVKQACEAARRRLTDDETTRVVAPDLRVGGQTVQLELELSRADAEVCWQPLLERLRGPALRALSDAGWRTADVNEVLLVGGATRMPCIARLASQLFGRLPLRTLPPDESVALGAAVQAGLKAQDRAVEDLVVTDVAPFTLGISSSVELGAQQISGMFAPIIERGTVIPASRVEHFVTTHAAQRTINVEVFQGEHARCIENQFLGSYDVKGIPAGPAGTQGIDVRFTYDMNGILDVDITVTGSNAKHSFVIEQRPGKLSKDELTKAREAMAAHKLHPRDALPNTTTLARAEALYLELVGPERAHLGNTVGLFRAALEAQEPDTVRAVREQLNGLINDFRSRPRG